MVLDYMESAERTEFEHCISNGDLKRCDDIVDLVERRLQQKTPVAQIHSPITFDAAQWQLIWDLLRREREALGSYIERYHRSDGQLDPLDEADVEAHRQLKLILAAIGLNGVCAVRYGVQPCR